MRKLTGVLIMSVMLALAACSGGQAPVSVTYTSSQTITIPAGVTNLALVSGQGAAGTREFTYYDDYYSVHTVSYNQRNDQGGTVLTADQGTTYNHGPVPANYCTAPTAYQTNGVTNYTWTCFDYTDRGSYQTLPATQGTEAQGFGLHFPGGNGGPATSTPFSNVAVTPGGPYNLTIPAGGSITISYYQ